MTIMTKERKEPEAAGQLPLLAVRDLVVQFPGKRGNVVANDHISLDIRPGETLGIVGESGSGKSVFCRAVLRILPSPPAVVEASGILFEGRDLMRLDKTGMRSIRGQTISMIFQNPMTSLNPVWPIGDQVAEPLRIHKRMSRADARAMAVQLLRQVGIPAPERRINDYPFQWSGGMLQRAAIAMAIAGAPKLMLADEPTTALDVTIQDQILALLLELQRESGMALVLVSHDMGVIAETCDRIAVMYAGRVVELGSVAQIFNTPAHPYTHGLLRSIARPDAHKARLSSIPGQPPDLAQLGAGCAFAERCSLASEECRAGRVDLRAIGPGHAAACLYPDRVPGLGEGASA
jgi:oligopeptide/dipeptide ABC transporter ATP-binding protein